ncbi:MAG: type III-B CRISPR module-associated protein Cmr3 [Promethearchaeota archaeon]
MRRLLIEPLDVLIFRNEMPFVAKETHVANLGTITPNIFEGALKSKLFSEFCYSKGYNLKYFQKSVDENLNNFKSRIENMINNDASGELKRILKIIGYSPLNFQSELIVIGVFFYNKSKEEEFLPIPNDIVKYTLNDGNSKVSKVFISKFSFENKFGKFHLGLSDYSQIEDIRGLISIENVLNYLNGDIPEILNFKEDGEWPYLKEIRTGIKLNSHNKKSEEGYIYSIEFMRLNEDWCFSIWYESSEQISDGILKLGGEGRGAISKNIADLDLYDKYNFQNIIESINEEKRFKLYLSVPCYFRGPIPPKDLLEKELKVSNLTLIAAFPGKPILIGGYDIAKNIPRPLKRWVNSGAVYYYKFKGEIPSNIKIPINIIKKESIIKNAFIGRWNNV